jgi:hypothetical protein
VSSVLPLYLASLNCYSNLAPGAQDLLNRITDPSLPEDQQIDVKRQIKHLTIEDWAILCNAFDEWPFAPEVMLTPWFEPGV